MREANQRILAGVVARAPVPLLGYACRAHLHHTEGYVGTHEYVSVVARAYLGVDV